MEAGQGNPGPLAGLCVLELCDRLGQYAGRLLADLGADVIKIEPPGGAIARQIGPFKDQTPHLERSLYFLHFNANKRSIVLDLHEPAGRDTFRTLVRGADAVLESFPPGRMAELGLGYDDLRRINPRLVLTSITGFGQHGPYSRYQAPDIVAFAMGGVMYFNGPPDRAPLVGPCEQGYQMAGAHAAYATLAALYHRLTRQGRGQWVDVAVQDVLISKPHLQFVARYDLYGEIQPRTGSQGSGGVPAACYPCRDGYVSFAIFNRNHWQEFRRMIGDPPALQDPIWDEQPFRYAHRDVVNLFILEFTRPRTRAEIVELAQAHHIATAPMNRLADFAADPQVLARGFFLETEALGEPHPEPGIPMRFSATPAGIRHGAPLLGEHNEEIFAGLLGLSSREMNTLTEQGVLR